MLRPDTQKIQNAFGRYCRDGKSSVPKVFLKENLPQYRKMIFNIISNALQKAYPLSHKMLNDEEKWEHIVERFFEKHSCSSNQIWKLPKEFLEYARKERLNEKQAIPYLLDLLAFEWAEIEVFMMADREISFSPVSDWKKDIPAINPYLVILDLNYPIDKIMKGDFSDQEKCLLACYRDSEDLYVYYLKLSDFGKMTLERLTQGHSFDMILNEMSHQIDNICVEELEDEAKSFFDLLMKKNIILGKKPDYLF